MINLESSERNYLESRFGEVHITKTHLESGSALESVGGASNAAGRWAELAEPMVYAFARCIARRFPDRATRRENLPGSAQSHERRTRWAGRRQPKVAAHARMTASAVPQ